HRDAVIDFFKDSSENLLVLDIMNSENNWNLLAPFLEVKSPNRSFPHANKASYRNGLWSRVKRSLKSVYYND
nr:hypothetical protein [Bacteroidota bacterium]